MESISTTIQDNFLTCTICLEVYKEPQTLPCLHTFCKECLHNFIKKSSSKQDSSICPICRRTFWVSRNEIKSNFCLQNMIDLLTVSSTSSQTFCSFCKLLNKDEKAVSQCLTCLEYVCEICAKERHTFTRQTIDHIVVPLSEVLEGKYDRELQRIQKSHCTHHRGEKLRYYCVPCRLPMCRDCIVIEHASHEVKLITDERKQREGLIKERLVYLKNHIETLNHNKSILSKRVNALSEKEEIIKKQMEKICTEVVQKILKIQAEKENEVSNTLKPAREQLVNSDMQCSEFCKQVEDCVTLSEKVMANGSDSELLSFTDEILRRMDELEIKNDPKYNQGPVVNIPDLQIVWKEPLITIVDRACSCKEPTTKEISTQTSFAVSNQGTQFDSMEDNSKKLSSTASGCNPQCLARYEIKLIEPIAIRESSDSVKPELSCVAWIDSDNIAVVDRGNEKIKLFELNGKSIKSINMPGAITISTSIVAIACRLADMRMKIFRLPFKEIKTDVSVQCLITASDGSSLMWMTKTNIFCYKDDAMSQVSIKNKDSSPTTLGTPRYASQLADGSYVVSDKGNDCVYLISNSGKIVKEIDHYPGSITHDNNDSIFISDFEYGTISILDRAGKPISKLKIGVWQNAPRSISIFGDRLLVATKFKILLYKLKKK